MPSSNLAGRAKRAVCIAAEVVLDNFQKRIEALEVWDGRVLAGLADGTLMVLQEEPGGGEGPRWQVTQAVKGFGQKRILQLQARSPKATLTSYCACLARV